MTDFRQLGPHMLASPQITVDDIAEAAGRGVKLVINNRPDGESYDQTPGADIERAARAQGLDYVAIPIDQSGFSDHQIEAMADAVANARGTVLAYCRSGTRSTMLWALAEASRGGDPAIISASVDAAGYNSRIVRPSMDALAARARAAD